MFKRTILIWIVLFTTLCTLAQGGEFTETKRNFFSVQLGGLLYNKPDVEVLYGNLPYYSGYSPSFMLGFDYNWYLSARWRITAQLGYRKFSYREGFYFDLRPFIEDSYPIEHREIDFFIDVGSLTFGLHRHFECRNRDFFIEFLGTCYLTPLADLKVNVFYIPTDSLGIPEEQILIYKSRYESNPENRPYFSAGMRIGTTLPFKFWGNSIELMLGYHQQSRAVISGWYEIAGGFAERTSGLVNYPGSHAELSLRFCFNRPPKMDMRNVEFD